MAIEHEKEKAYEHGCDGIITKPIDVNIFATTIALYINKDMKKQLILR